MMKQVEQLQYIKTSILACPECERPVRLLHGRYGLFFGCRRYPTCQGSIGLNRAMAMTVEYRNNQPDVYIYNPDAYEEAVFDETFGVADDQDITAKA